MLLNEDGEDGMRSRGRFIHHSRSRGPIDASLVKQRQHLRRITDRLLNGAINANRPIFFFPYRDAIILDPIIPHLLLDILVSIKQINDLLIVDLQE